MKIIGVIPARMASTRFPGKPLAKILGLPMIGHVYFRSKLCSLLEGVFIATCDKAIQDYAVSIGAPCVMTSYKHERASERTAEAVEKIEALSGQSIDRVMMIQGDEPLLQPELLERAMTPLKEESTLNVVNLMAAITNEEDFSSPNVVKLVVGLNQNALYFSRERIPSRKKWNRSIPMFKQLGLIAFRRSYLAKYVSLSPSPLEMIESVDMLRVLEYGDSVRMVLVEGVSIGVDTPEDLARVEKLISEDLLLPRYLGSAVL
ncbi:MAG: 3-deoxy-manno-octulosonate cytidylyltransferase [Chlamydiae bacterium]|nr:3-deoxy-manno-octulosonate cytidylyltransferase [Chlamydiota bacterium]MBI3276232.1 3-deoxy-manno-octulosonate cytidylyltransferase [Chlamydiota bacterium]